MVLIVQPSAGMKTLAAVLVLLSVLHRGHGASVWAEYAQSPPVLGITGQLAYQIGLFGEGTAGLYDYLHITPAQAPYASPSCRKQATRTCLLCGHTTTDPGVLCRPTGFDSEGASSGTSW